MFDLFAMTFTVDMPALAVIDPTATRDVHAVIFDLLANKLPALAMLDPTATSYAFAVMVESSQCPSPCYSGSHFDMEKHGDLMEN